MSGYEHLTRAGLISLVRQLKADQTKGPRPARGRSVRFPIFGERQLQEFETSSCPMRIFEHRTLRYLAVNDAALKLYGYTRQEFLNLNLRDTRHPDEYADQAATLREPTGYLTHWGPRRHVTKSGEIIVAEIVTQDILLNGRKARLSLTVDVTERIRVMERLRESNEFLRSVIESSRDCIKVLDLDGRLLWINDTGRRLLEIDNVSALDNRSYLDFWNGPDREKAKSALASARAGTASSFEGYGPTMKGGPKWWDEIVTPMLDAGGRPEKLLVVSRNITKRRGVERALHESESKYRNLVESSSDLIWSADVEGRITFINQAARRIYGYEPEEMLGRPVSEFLGDGSPKKAFGFFRAMLAAGRSLADYECEVRRKDGEPVVLSSNAIVLRDAEGKRIGVTGISKDITARKRAEQALREKTEFLERMIESSRDCIKVLDLEGRLLWISVGGQRLMEIDEVSSLLGKSYLDFWSGSDRDAARNALVAALAGGVSRFEAYCPTTKGVPKWWDELVTPMLDNDGRPEKLLVVSRDITEHKRAEIALRESEERFRQLAENVREVFWINTPAGDHIDYISPGYEEIWGRSRESLYLNPRSWMEPIHPGDLPAVQNGQEKMARGQRTDVDYRIIRPDGTLRWIRDRSYPMKRGDGTRLVCGIAEDITESKQAEARRIADMVRQRDALVREVHHRIKNNLQGVVGLLRQLAADDSLARPVIDKAISQLQAIAVVHGLEARRVRRMIGLRDILLAIGTAVQGMTPAEFELDLGAAEDARVQLAETEAVAVALVLNELLLNAARSSESMPKSGGVSVMLRTEAESIRVTISNPGRLPPQFDFAHARGLGTGLELVRSLLPQNGARLTFSEAAGRVNAELEISAPVLVMQRSPALAHQH